jgi:hypothetical protein
VLSEHVSVRQRGISLVPSPQQNPSRIEIAGAVSWVGKGIAEQEPDWWAAVVLKLRQMAGRAEWESPQGAVGCSFFLLVKAPSLMCRSIFVPRALSPTKSPMPSPLLSVQVTPFYDQQFIECGAQPRRGRITDIR